MGDLERTLGLGANELDCTSGQRASQDYNKCKVSTKITSIEQLPLSGVIYAGVRADGKSVVYRYKYQALVYEISKEEYDALAARGVRKARAVAVTGTVSTESPNAEAMTIPQDLYASFPDAAAFAQQAVNQAISNNEKAKAERINNAASVVVQQHSLLNKT
jgi:hypothetical protein